MVMGKKKPQKTKELSVAIAEASSTGAAYDDTQQPQNEHQTPRKRGRPRKITEKTETSSKEEIVEEKEEEASGRAEVSESSSKKGKTSEVEEQGQQHEGSSACTQSSKDPKGEPSRSRARRKSKPRKSS